MRNKAAPPSSSRVEGRNPGSQLLPKVLPKAGAPRALWELILWRSGSPSTMQASFVSSALLLGRSSLQESRVFWHSPPDTPRAVGALPCPPQGC